MLANNNQNTGQLGEDIACDYLLSNHYKVLDRNVNFSNQEVDIIAFKKNKHYIVEVKTSSIYSKSDPEDYVNREKLRNLKKAAFRYSKINKVSLEEIYFDLLAIRLDKSKRIAKIKHYKNII